MKEDVRSAIVARITASVTYRQTVLRIMDVTVSLAPSLCLLTRSWKLHWKPNE